MNPKTDEEILREATQKQREDRRALGIDVATGRGGSQETPSGALAKPGQRGLAKPLVDFKQALPPEGTYRCSQRWEGVRCEAVIPYPGICTACSERLEREQRAEAIALRIPAEIPLEYRDVRWENLLELRTDQGKPRVPVTAERFQRIRTLLQGLAPHERVVIVGYSGNGKSTLAAAWARGLIESGAERVCFARARKLLALRPSVTETAAPCTVAEYAEAASWLVIDDLGDELHNAPAESGIAAQRIEAMRTLLAERYERRRGFVLTTGLTEEKIGEIYNDGTRRRVFEGAHVIPLDRSTPR